MERDRIAVLSEGQDGYSRDCFDHVVNALWDGRLALNEALGFRTNRPWLHRLKYGVSFRLPSDVQAASERDVRARSFWRGRFLWRWHRLPHVVPRMLAGDLHRFDSLPTGTHIRRSHFALA